MSGEFWRKIQEAQEAFEGEEGRKREAEAASRIRRFSEETEKVRRNERISEEKRRKEEQERRLVTSAQSALLKIFEDIRVSAPAIRQSRLSRAFICQNHEEIGGLDFYTDQVILMWGEKFNFTPEEKALVEKYEFRPLIPLFSPPLPDQIVNGNYNFILGGITPPRITLEYYHSPGGTYIEVIGDKVVPGWINFLPNNGGNNRIDTAEFLLNPNITIPVIAKCLLSPIHQQRIYYKGRDYWTTKAEKYPERRIYGTDSYDSPNTGG